MTLIVEVSNSYLDRDRHDKARIYARAGIAAYWVVDVVNGVVEVFEQPSGPTAAPGYATTRTVGRSQPLTFAVDGVTPTLPAADLLP